MDRQPHQWLPPNHPVQRPVQPNNSSPLLSPSSHASVQTLQDQFSRFSLSGSDIGSSIPNLPRQNLDQLRSYFAAKAHEVVNPNSCYSPGSSSYTSYPTTHFNMGSGSGLGLGFASPTRNEFRSNITIDDDVTLRRRVHEMLYANNNNNNYSHSALASLLYNKYYHDDHQINYNNTNLMRRNPITTRSNHHSNNINNSAIPISLVYYPATWEEIKGKVVYFANDKSLSQFIIKKFELGQMEGIKMVVSELKVGVTQVLFNLVGSQFFQRLLDFLDHQDVFELIKAVMANQQEFVHICLDSQGTRAAQKLLKFMDRNSREEKAILLNAIRGVAVTLTKNMNGYHFIEELLKNFRGVYEVIGPLLSEVADHCVDIAMDKSGCCVMQHCIQHGQGSERDRIIHQIITHALELSENDYGNYVVQFVVGMKSDPHIVGQAISGLEGNFVSLSKNKFGSHVVEKCLKEADDEHVNKIISEIIQDPNSFLDILQHPNGNFVAQTALHRSKEMQACNRPSMYSILVERINANYAFLHSHMHGKRVLSHVKCHKFRVMS